MAASKECAIKSGLAQGWAPVEMTCAWPRAQLCSAHAWTSGWNLPRAVEAERRETGHSLGTGLAWCRHNITLAARDLGSTRCMVRGLHIFYIRVGVKVLRPKSLDLLFNNASSFSLPQQPHQHHKLCTRHSWHNWRCDNFCCLLTLLTISIKYTLWMLSRDQKITCSPVSPVSAVLCSGLGRLWQLQLGQWQLSAQPGLATEGREQERAAGSRAPVLAVCTSPA